MKKAQSLIEYALILILISMIAISTLHFLGKRMSFKNSEEQVNSYQNILETMTEYCNQKGLVYNEQTSECEQNVLKTSD